MPVLKTVLMRPPPTALLSQSTANLKHVQKTHVPIPEDPWPRSIAMMGYGLLAASVPASILTGFVEWPSARERVFGEEAVLGSVNAEEKSSAKFKLLDFLRSQAGEIDRQFTKVGGAWRNCDDDVAAADNALERDREESEKLWFANENPARMRNIMDQWRTHRDGVPVTIGIMDSNGTNEREISLTVPPSSKPTDHIPPSSTITYLTFPSTAPEGDEKLKTDIAARSGVGGEFWPLDRGLFALTHTFSSWEIKGGSENWGKADSSGGDGGGGGARPAAKTAAKTDVVNVDVARLDADISDLKRRYEDPNDTSDMDGLMEEIRRLEKERRSANGGSWFGW